MDAADQTNADQKAFWNGIGGQIWVERQAHTDSALTPITDALLAFARPAPAAHILDIGCGCGASTLDFAKQIGPGGKIQALDISEVMLFEGARRMEAAGLQNVVWQQEDAASATLEPFDLLISAFGCMFFGDPVAAFSHMARAAKPGARLALVCWRGLDDNPWMGVPMAAVAQHLSPRAPSKPGAPGMFAFADPGHVSDILVAAGWAPPSFEALDVEIDLAAGKGLAEAIAQTTQIGAVNSWLRGQSGEVVAACMTSLRKALTPYVDDDSVRLPAGAWLIASQKA